MRINTEAKKTLVRLAHEHPTRVVSNYDAFLVLAQRIADADKDHVEIDTKLIEQAAKNALGVD